MPPVALPASNEHFYSYNFPPSCPQYLSKTRSVWNSNITDFWISAAGQSLVAGDFAQTTDEDCLRLAVWAPLNITADAKLPVVLFIPGGSFQTGGVHVPYQNPGGWVDRGQKHIAVVAQYRVNIMGFPYAVGVEDQNPGLIDVRMALEWVHSNIAAFGGDKDRITLWGQSAGGVAVDMVMYGWPDDPLAAGVFMQSGTAMVNVSYPDKQYLNFSFVAKNMGCDFPNDGASELRCMQKVPVVRIINFVGNYSDSGATPSISFKPMPDDRTVFFNYTARAEKGLYAKIPALVSTTANELASLSSYPKNLTTGPNQTAIDAGTVSVFVCLTSNTTDVRAKLGLTTYRYQYAGNFSNLTPFNWLGAYHASDIPLLMGTYELPGPASDLEVNTANTMQDYLFAFIADPLNGLKVKGWEPHDRPAANGGYMVRFGSDGQIQQAANTSSVDFACIFGDKYNSAP
jgi:carboxylesterase type B